MENKENKKIERKNKIIKVTALLGLFLLVFGVSYALFKVTLEGKKKNKIATGTLSLKITDLEGNDEKDLPEGSMGLNIENAVPMSAQEAIDTIEPYEFNIVNDGTIDADYEIYIETSEDTTLDASKIKYNLTRTDTGEVLSMNYLDSDAKLLEEPEENNSMSNESYNITRLLSEQVTTIDGKTLYKLDLGTIGEGQTYKYSLKMWLSYAVGVESMGKTFSGKLKLYGHQVSKDSAYVVDQIDITPEENKIVPGWKLYAKYYSDNSIRFEGLGTITAAMTRKEEYSNWFNRLILAPQLMPIINNILETYDYETFNDVDTFINKILIEEDVSGYSNECIEKIGEVLENIDNYVSYDLYIGDGITVIEREALPGCIKNLYISTTVNMIGYDAFTSSNLEKVEFYKAADHYIYNNQEEVGLTIDASVFKSANLKSIKILNNLKQLGYTATNGAILGDPFAGCFSADIIIEAKQSDVKISSTAFSDVKSVTWVNG